MPRVSLRTKLLLLWLSALAYILMDVPVRMTGVLPVFAGVKNFLPVTLGLFFGVWGVCGLCAGSVLSALIVYHPAGEVFSECICIAVIGLGMFYGWHFRQSDHRIHLKTLGDYMRFIVLLAVLSAAGGNILVWLAYFVTGLFIGVPVNILLSSLLYVEPLMPGWCSYDYDAVFCLMNGAESLDDANELIEAAAMEKNIPMKRVFEIQSCLEELLIRIVHAVPDAQIHVMLQYGDAISAWMNYSGRKYNPFVVEKDEDEIDIMSLKIIKHRALRASFTYSERVNKVHVVV